MKFFKTKLLLSGLFAACVLTAGDNLLVNGDAEGGNRTWVGLNESDTSADEAVVGKNSFKLTLSKPEEHLSYAQLIPVEAGAEYHFSVVAGVEEGGGAMRVEIVAYDRYGQKFDALAVSPVAGGEARLLRATKAGEKVIYIEPENRSLWKRDESLAVAFNCDNSGEFSDLPNRDLVRGIVNAKKVDYGWEVTLAEPVPAAFSVGGIRLHRAAGAAEESKSFLLESGSHRYSYKFKAPAGAAYLKVALSFDGGKGSVLLDELYLGKKPYSGKFTDTAEAQIIDHDARNGIITLYNELGYRLDKAVCDGGSAADVAAAHLAATGASSAEAASAGEKLCAQYAELMAELEEAMASYTVQQGTKPTVDRLALLSGRVAEFEANASAVMAAMAALREALPPLAEVKHGYAKDYLFNRFILGMAIKDTTFSGEQQGRPGRYYDPEYISVAMNEAMVNVISYENKMLDGDFSVISALCRNTPAPILAKAISPFPWEGTPIFLDGESSSFHYFGNPAKFKDDALKFMKTFADYPNCIGVQLAEPQIVDVDLSPQSYRSVALNDSRKLMSEWRKHYNKVRAELQRSGANLPAANLRSIPAPAEDPAGTIAHMEWQFFKKKYLGTNLERQYNDLVKEGVAVSPVVMDWNSLLPQQSSYVELASRLPYVGTRLLRYGSLGESFSMQLFRSAAKDRAIMYSGESYLGDVSAFNRSLAVGLAYGDGIHTQTHEYCFKYRDPNDLWSYNGADEFYPLRRKLAASWSSDYWGELVRCYKLAAANQEYLANRRSAAKVAMLHSERNAIAIEDADYFWSQVGLYSALVAAQVPSDVLFIDLADAKQLSTYSLLIVADMEAMTVDEEQLLRDYVRNGGRLLAIGKVGTANAWGVPTDDFALKDVFGAEFGGMQRVSGASDTRLGRIHTNSALMVARLQNIAPTATAWNWSSRQVAAVENSYGKGSCLYLALPSGGFFINDYTTYPGLPELISALIKEAAPPEFTFTDLPIGVEVSLRLTDKGDRVLVLIDRTGRGGAIGGYTINCGAAALEVLDLGSGSSSVSDANGQVAMAGFKDYAVIVIKKAGKR